MKIFIDADGCPVINLTIDIAKQNHISCVIISDTSHEFHYNNVETITVSQGSDSADFKIVNLVSAGDIVVTQDYGLAAMCLSKNVKVLNQNGLIYNDFNIDGLLQSRHISKKIRMSGGHTKGPAKRKSFQNDDFSASLINLIKA